MKQAEAIWQSNLTGKPVAGMIITTIASGDQVTLPSQVVESAAQLDEFADRKTIRDLVALAERAQRPQ